MIFRIPGCQVGVTWCFFGIQGDQVTILGKKCRFICKIKKKVLSLRGFSGTACRSAGGCAARPAGCYVQDTGIPGHRYKVFFRDTRIPGDRYKDIIRKEIE